MIDIPLNAKVECVDGSYGESTCVIINPITKKVTHFVVQGTGLHSSKEHLVSIDQVVETTSATIRLACTKDELVAMQPFVKTHYIKSKAPVYPGYYYDYVFISPYVTNAVTGPSYIPVEEECIPPGELAVRRGARVEATDGNVGKVAEFLVDPASGHITHMVLMEGHLWGKKEISLPISSIENAYEDRVDLKLDKQAIKALPAIAVKRHYGKQSNK